MKRKRPQNETALVSIHYAWDATCVRPAHRLCSCHNRYGLSIQDGQVKVKTKPVYLYILSCQGFSKIGYSSNPAIRIYAIQSSCPFKVTLEFIFELPDEIAARLAERWCHFKLKRYWNGYNEWLKISPRRAAATAPHVFKEGLTHKPGWSILSLRLTKATLAQNWTVGKRKAQSERIRKQFGDPSFLKAIQDSLKKRWDDPVYRQRASDRARTKSHKRWELK